MALTGIWEPYEDTPQPHDRASRRQQAQAQPTEAHGLAPRQQSSASSGSAPGRLTCTARASTGICMLAYRRRYMSLGVGHRAAIWPVLQTLTSALTMSQLHGPSAESLKLPLLFALATGRARLKRANARPLTVQTLHRPKMCAESDTTTRRCDLLIAAALSNCHTSVLSGAKHRPDHESPPMARL